jgi:hypothetical protein
MNTEKRLPDEIRYLQPFLRRLGRRSPDDLNECVDSSLLEEALRQRVRGLSIVEAQRQLNADRRTLHSWLASSALEANPAHWVLGFLSHSGLARELLRARSAKPAEPVIELEPPPGWLMRSVPFNLNLRKGKLRAFITAINEFTFRNLQLPASRVITSGEGRIDEQDVQFGKTTGKKYLRLQTVPVPWRQLDYVLAVPGGFASIMLCRTDGREFDEIPFEATLHTLRIG